MKPRSKILWFYDDINIPTKEEWKFGYQNDDRSNIGPYVYKDGQLVDYLHIKKNGNVLESILMLLLICQCMKPQIMVELEITLKHNISWHSAASSPPIMYFCRVNKASSSSSSRADTYYYCDYF